MSYSVALEMRQSALRWAQTPRAADWFYSATSKAMSEKSPDEDIRRWAEGFRTVCHTSLSLSETYYWHPSLCDSIQDATLSAPPITLRREMLPSEYGFCWFGSPLLDPGEPDPDMTALSWAIHDNMSIVITPWFRLDDVATGIPCGHILWDFGGTQGRMLAAPEDLAVDDKSNWLVRLLGSMLLFMEQRIAVAVPTEPDRATRRRLLREQGVSEALIQVVQLRRSLSQEGHQRAGAASAVDWSCQWPVRPHWATRRCGKGREEARPVWIDGYVKGPSDKPLRVSGDRLFVVAR